MKMLCFLSFLLFPFSTIYAQDATKKKFWAGPTVGLSRNSQFSNIASSPGYLTSPNLGAKLKYSLGSKLKLNGMLTYAERRISTDMKTTLEEKYRYLDFPVMVSYELGVGNIKFYPMAGIHNGFLLSGRIVTQDPSDPSCVNTYNLPKNPPWDADISKYQLGYTVGVGNQYILNQKLRLFLDLRDTRAISNVWNGDTNWNLLDFKRPKFHHHFLSINTGVLF